jgi:hypothetical protein
MSYFWVVMIISWSSAVAIIGFYALKESGTLIRLRKRMKLQPEKASAPSGMLRQVEGSI